VSANGIHRARSADYWAKEWKVHRNTARSWLKNLHEKYGEVVVQRVGKRGQYRASVEALRRVAVGPDADVVTHAQLSRALGQVWEAIETIGGKAWRLRAKKSDDSHS
jgi:hypothetical protein